MSALGQKQTFVSAVSMSALGHQVSEGSCDLSTKDKGCLCWGAPCGAAFKSGKGLGTHNALAPYAV
jgi:hypothetical protein